MATRTKPPAFPEPYFKNTQQRAYPQLMSGSPTDIQQVFNQAFDSIFRLSAVPQLPQMYHVWFVDSTSGTDNLEVGTDLTNHVECRLPEGVQIQLFLASLNVAVAPVGANLIIDIQRSFDNANWLSIFPAGNASKLIVKDGEFRGSTPAFCTDPSPFFLIDGDLLRYDVLQVGSTTPGRKAGVSLVGIVQNRITGQTLP
jgi:hypothetical protein